MSSGLTLPALAAIIIGAALPACSAPNPFYAENRGSDASANADVKDAAEGGGGGGGDSSDNDAAVETPAPVDTRAPDGPEMDLTTEVPSADLPADETPEPAPDANVAPADAMPADLPLADLGSVETVVRPDLVTGLIGYWRMDEPVGSLMARDSSGLNHHGVLEALTASDTWVPTGRFGSAINISDDDRNAGVRVEATSRIASIQKYTVAAWARRLRPRPVAYQSIISRQRGQGIAEVFDMSVSMDKLNAYAPDRTSAGVTSVVVQETAPVGSWFHAAASFDGTTLRIYQNGVLGAATTWAGTLPASDRPLYLGTNKNESGPSNAHHPWEGQLDEILLYDVVLGDQAIKALAAGERPSVP